MLDVACNCCTIRSSSLYQDRLNPRTSFNALNYY